MVEKENTGNTVHFYCSLVNEIKSNFNVLK